MELAKSGPLYCFCFTLLVQTLRTCGDSVFSLHLSLLQKDHISIALDDLMRRYTPPVSQSCYRLSFVPVWGEEEEEAGRERDSGVSLDCSEEEISSPAGTPAHSSGRELRSRGHLLRSARFCWCDRDTRDMILRVYIYHQVQ